MRIRIHRHIYDPHIIKLEKKKKSPPKVLSLINLLFKQKVYKQFNANNFNDMMSLWTASQAHHMQ